MFVFRISHLKNLPVLRQLYQSYRQVVPVHHSVLLKSLCTSSDGGSKSLVDVVEAIDSKCLSVHWQDGHARFHHLWLRHHCPCQECLNPKTKQRTIDMALIPEGVQPRQVNFTSDTIDIVWDDGHETRYDGSWLRYNAYDGALERNCQEKSLGTIAYESQRILWTRDIVARKPPPEFNYSDIVKGDKDVLRESLNCVLRYGFAFVNQTPADEKSLLNVCQAIAGPIMETPEGRVYVLESDKELMSSDLSHYSHALSAHTDYTFYQNPPGIQAIQCVHHNATGGVSLLVDGLNAAKILFQEDPDAYKILTRTNVPFVCTYHGLETMRSVFELDPLTKELTTIRFNNSRVSTFAANLKLNFDEMERFYDAMRSYSSILRRPENELWFKITPGKIILMDNHRTLHGRSEVQGPRKIIGCYVSFDDYLGKWKLNNELM